MLKSAWALWSRGSEGSSEEEGVLPANEKKLGSGKLSRQPPVNADRQHRENGRRISAPHHVPFRRTKPLLSSGICLKLKNVYSLEHSQPKTYIIPGILKNNRGGRGARRKKIESEFHFNTLY